MRNWCALTHCFYRVSDMVFCLLYVLRASFVCFIIFSLSPLRLSVCVLLFLWNCKNVLDDCVPEKHHLRLVLNETMKITILLHGFFFFVRIFSVLLAVCFFIIVWFYYISVLRTLGFWLEICNTFAEIIHIIHRLNKVAFGFCCNRELRLDPIQM